jgi:hypothetical protein
MKGSVKIMLSYDYSHFEVALATDKELDAAGVNEMRKTAQRLADEAVRQYKRAKEAAERQLQGKYERQNALHEIQRIEAKPEQERTVREVALLKEHQDENWEEQFKDDYDYDDDDDPDFGEGDAS